MPTAWDNEERDTVIESVQSGAAGNFWSKSWLSLAATPWVDINHLIYSGFLYGTLFGDRKNRKSKMKQEMKTKIHFNSKIMSHS